MQKLIVCTDLVFSLFSLYNSTISLSVCIITYCLWQHEMLFDFSFIS